MLEQHPVPQNVTTFQFRLIGDMTLKQFGYLAGGAILAYISFNLPLPFFFTYPLTAVFALGGIGFAFVPIEERPMDIWFVSFIKSIYSPTQYIWQRETFATTPTSNQTHSGFTVFSDIVAKILPIPKKATSSSPTTGEQPTVPTQQTPPVIEFPSFTSLFKTKQQTIHPSSPTINSTRMANTPIPPQSPIPQQTTNQSQPPIPSIEERLKQMEQQLALSQLEKKKLEQELQLIKQQINTPASVNNNTPTAVPPSVTLTAPPQPSMPSLSLHPNVISGIVREHNGNMLVGILVTVKDKDDVPVRALKTNKLGQFAASTQLPNGVYKIEAEDPKKQFAFEQEDITLTGNVVPPLQIIAKSKQQLERQQLEKALFGVNNTQ